MNIHSVPVSASARRRSEPAPTAKRDAILRAAIDVFAERGFFNAQVADVARAAGVAAGTDRKSTRLNSSHIQKSRMPSSA